MRVALPPSSARQISRASDEQNDQELVTADGCTLRASSDEHADLFWAVRGGGGNFGIVTSFEFRLHGAVSYIGPTETAFALREEHYAFQIMTGWNGEGATDRAGAHQLRS